MKHPLAAPAALIVAVPLALLPATAALAATDDVVTPGWVWEVVEDNGYRIGDAEAAYIDFLDSGVDLIGWTDNPWDSMMRVTAFDPGVPGFVPTYPIIRYDGAEQGPLTITPVSSNWVDFGRTTTVGTATADFGDGVVVTVTFTLEIENSTARWTITPVVENADSSLVEIEFGGDLGSDGDTVYVDLGGGAWVTHDDGRDPVIAWRLDGPTNDIEDPDLLGGVVLRAPGSSISTVTTALLDYDPCSFADAIDTMTELAPSLVFAQTIEPLYATDCLLADDPASIELGEAADELLALTPAPELQAVCCWVPETVEDFDDRDWQVDIVDAPGGLLAALEWSPDAGSFGLRLSGTPTEPWSEPALFVVHYDREPVLVQIDFEVAAAELADSGSAGAETVAVAGAVLALAGAALLIVARRRAASH